MFFFFCDIPKGDLRIQLGIELGALFFVLRSKCGNLHYIKRNDPGCRNLSPACF